MSSMVEFPKNKIKSPRSNEQFLFVVFSNMQISVKLRSSPTSVVTFTREPIREMTAPASLISSYRKVSFELKWDL